MQGVRYNLIHVRTGIFYRELRGTQVMNPRFNAAALYNARGRYASLEHLLAPPPAGFGADPIRVGEAILISGDRHAIVNQLLINGNRPFKADDSHYWREALVVRCSSKRLQVRASGKTLAFVLIAGSKYVDHLQSDGQVGWSLTEERWRNPGEEWCVVKTIAGRETCRELKASDLARQLRHVWQDSHKVQALRR